MKNYIWILLCGLSGLSGFWIGRKSVEVKYRKMLREEVQGLKKYYKNQIDKNEREYREKFEELGFAGYFRGDKKFSSIDLRDDSSMHPSSIIYETPVGVQRKMVTDMQTVADRYQEQDFADMDRDQESDDEEEEDLYSEEELILNHPYVISAEEYHEEKNWYDKEEFDFYQEDAALVNDQEEIILNWEDEIGEDALAILLTIEPKDVHEVYVRNDQESTDYLITVKPGSASKLGFVPIGREG